MLIHFRQNKKGWVGSYQDMLYFIDKRNPTHMVDGIYDVDLNTANIYQPQGKGYCFIRSEITLVDCITYETARNIDSFAKNSRIPEYCCRYPSGQIGYSFDSRSIEILVENDGKIDSQWVGLIEQKIHAENYDASELLAMGMKDAKSTITEWDMLPLMDVSHYIISYYNADNDKIVSFKRIGIVCEIKIEHELWSGPSTSTEYYMLQHDRQWEFIPCESISGFENSPNIINDMVEFCRTHLICTQTYAPFALRTCPESVVTLTSIFPGGAVLECTLFNPHRITEDIYEKEKDAVEQSFKDFFDEGRQLMKSGMNIKYAPLCNPYRFMPVKIK